VIVLLLSVFIVIINLLMIKITLKLMTSQTAWVHFTNILCSAFKSANLKSAKKTDGLTVFFALFGSESAKAANKILMKLTADLPNFQIATHVLVFTFKEIFWYFFTIDLKMSKKAPISNNHRHPGHQNYSVLIFLLKKFKKTFSKK